MTFHPITVDEDRITEAVNDSACATKIRQALHAVNLACGEAHTRGLCVEIEQIDTRTVEERFGQVSLHARVERRKEII